MLVDLTTQNTYKPISPNWANAAKINGGVKNYEQLTKEVEENEVRKLLGVALLQDIQKNPNEARNEIILNGGSFEYCDTTLDFKGLRYIISFFNYSRYVGESFVSDTFTGMVKKNRNESESLSSGDIKRLQYEAREIAFAEWDLLKKFICENTDTYTLWGKSNTKKIYTPKFTGIRKTFN